MKCCIGLVGEGLDPPATFPFDHFIMRSKSNLSVGYGACDVPKPFAKRHSQRSKSHLP